MLLLSVVYLMVLAATDAYLWPSSCPPQLPDRVPCCPTHSGSPCGEAEGRGKCVALPPRAVGPNGQMMDDRHRFPSFYYNSTCVCNGNYGGPNCGGCKFYHNGTNCEPVRVHRRDYRELTPAEMMGYKNKMHYCKTLIDPDYLIMRAGNRFNMNSYEFFLDTHYNGWCFIHYYATKPFLNNSRENYITNYAHSGPGFLGWHRMYLIVLENSIQRCLRDPTFALVYYDWRRDSTCAACTDSAFGANDARGFISPLSIFSKWRCVCGNFDYERTYCLMSDSTCERPVFRRQAGYVSGVSMPNKADVDYCMSLTAMDVPPYTRSVNGSFRSCMEGWTNRFGQPATTMHNAFHVYMGATMAQVPKSCNDPMFILHHVLIDCLFEKWLKDKNFNPNSYPRNTIYGHGPEENITPFFNQVSNKDMMVQLSVLGVTCSIFDGQ